MEFKDKDIIEEVAIKVQDTPRVEPKLPAGYIPVRLSTNGKLGVPKQVHVRNFTTEDLLDLSIASESFLPTKTIQTLNRIIYEKDVDVALWPEKSVTELLIKIYSNFFTPFISDVPFPWNEEDIAFLKEKGKEDVIEALKKKEFVPKISLNLAKDVNIQEIDPEVKDFITIRRKDGSFKATFSAYPKLGDLLLLKKASDDLLREESVRWEEFKKRFELRERLISNGVYENLPKISEEDLALYYEFEAKKSQILVKLTQALYLKSIMDIDLSNIPLVERLSYLDDPRLDVTVTKKIEAQYDKIKFGVKDEIKVINPITGLECTRRFSFRTMDILQAIRSFDSTEYDISYDD